MGRRINQTEQWHPDPTPGQLEELKRQVREEGFENDRGEFRKPWPKHRLEPPKKPVEIRVFSSGEVGITDDESI